MQIGLPAASLAPFLVHQHFVHVAAVGQRGQFVERGQLADRRHRRHQVFLLALQARAQLAHFAGQQRDRDQRRRRPARSASLRRAADRQPGRCATSQRHGPRRAWPARPRTAACVLARAQREGAEHDHHQQDHQPAAAQRAGDRIGADIAGDREQRLRHRQLGWRHAAARCWRAPAARTQAMPRRRRRRPGAARCRGRRCRSATCDQQQHDADHVEQRRSRPSSRACAPGADRRPSSAVAQWHRSTGDISCAPVGIASRLRGAAVRPTCVGRHRTAEQVALHFVAVVIAQEAALLFGLDAFGDHPQVELVAERDDGHARWPGRPALSARSLTKDLSIFRRADRERLERRQARIAGAEVVDRQRHAHRLQFAHLADRLRQVAHDQAFRHFDFQRRRRQAAVAQRLRRRARPGAFPRTGAATR